MLGERTAPTGSPETFIGAAIDPACCGAGRPAADNRYSVFTRVSMAVTDRAIADHATVLGLGTKGSPRCRQNHQRQGKGYDSLHESKLPLISNRSQQSGLLAPRPASPCPWGQRWGRSPSGRADDRVPRKREPEHSSRSERPRPGLTSSEPERSIAEASAKPTTPPPSFSARPRSGLVHAGVSQEPTHTLA